MTDDSRTWNYALAYGGVKPEAIGKLLVRKSGNPDLALPRDKTRPHKWLRNFPCPFCGGEEAAINWGMGLFMCFHRSCPVRRLSVAGKWSTVRRFWPQVCQAARNAAGPAIHELEARRYARQRLLVYDGDSDDADAGLIAEAEFRHNADPELVDRDVLRALNCDLLDKVRKIRRGTERQVGLGGFTVLPDEDLSDRGRDTARLVDRLSRDIAARSTAHRVPLMFSGDADLGFDAREFPCLHRQVNLGYTISDIAAEDDVSKSTIDRRISDEKALLHRRFCGCDEAHTHLQS